MPILTANINFLASLGITTSEQFMAAFGDMAAFTEYCDEIGYSWEIDENNDLILITPNGNTVNTYIEFEAKTATPTITVTPGNTAYTIEATGEGTVKLYIDDVEVFNPVSIERTTESQEITVTATAQAEGKEISDEAEEEIVIPALDTTAAPDIEAIPGLDSYDIVALGDGTVKLYLGGNEVANPYTVVRTDQTQTLTFTATAQETGKQISETTEEEFVIPALPISDTPVITATKRDADYLISVSAGQDAVINITCDGEAMANPFVITRGNSNTTVTIIATATEPHHSMATTSQQVLIEALPITATPTISYTQGLTAYTITASGNGTVLLYADGVATQNPCSISRTTTSQTIVFTATAQEADHQISATATETVTIPAMEVTATPVITYDSTTFTVDVTGNGTVLSYVDGVATQMPHTFTQGTSAVTYVVTATAQEVGKQISATATENCLVPAGVIKDYLKVTAIDNGVMQITIPASIDSTKATSLSYSKDGVNWTTTAVDNTAQTIDIPFNSGDDIYFKGIANQWAIKSGRYIVGLNIKTRSGNTERINLSGNVMSLIYGDNFENQTSFPANTRYNLAGIFSNEEDIQGDLSQLTLPATTLNYGCYESMFMNDTHITTAPALPATTLAANCYSEMFYSCKGLTSAPALPATTLAAGCYSSMFQGCASLTTASALPATTLAQECYADMFSGCSSLTTAPSLPATALANGCYFRMFYLCHLTTAPALPATTLEPNCYAHMFEACSYLHTAPVLPATTLADYCYQEMFRVCYGLNNITMLAEDISATGCLSNWVQAVAGSGTFTKSANMTTLPTGNSGIPTGWTVVDAA